MEMDDHYGISVSDLRHFISRPIVAQLPAQPSSLASPSDLFVAHHNHRGLPPLAGVPARPHPYESHEADLLNQQQQQYCNPTSVTATTTVSCGFDGGDGGVARWPRQETLTLLEVRSRLDYKFKEANQKGPIWDELARIMCEEHGYQRSGKKCREKFENLYKYYKKTRDGKAGRQDGKHYRFFRQLDALYGDHNNTHHHHNNHHYPLASTSEAAHHIAGNDHFHNNNPNIIPSSKLRATDEPILWPTSASLSNTSSDYETSSSDNDVGGSFESDELKKKGKRSWKVKIKQFIDQQMRRIMEKQEAWLDKVMKALENREKESIEREQEWRNKEIERMEKEHLFWARERAWIEARDSALMTALEKMSKEPCHRHQQCDHDHDHHSCRIEIIHGGNKNHELLETEVTRLIQLRSSMESRFQQCGFSEEVLWEDIAAKMSYFGYNRSASVCKEKWDSISKYFQEKDNLIIRDVHVGNKKRKENYEEVRINHNNSYNNDNLCYSNHINEGNGGVYIYMNRLGGFTSNCEIIEPRLQLNERSSSHNSKFNANANVGVNPNNNASVAAGSVMNDSCLRFFLGEGEGEGEGEGDFGNWEGNPGLKLNKNGVNNCV